MLRFLFPRLTTHPARGAELFRWVTERAREPHWYLAGEVPDTVDGRFAMLAAVTALVLVRLEEEGPAGTAASVALTERFVDAMEAEHREMGLGDPTLGKTVRKLVGLLARRVERWRGATAGETDWNDAARISVYNGNVAQVPLTHTAEALGALWSRISSADATSIAEGRI